MKRCYKWIVSGHKPKPKAGAAGPGVVNICLGRVRRTRKNGKKNGGESPVCVTKHGNLSQNPVGCQ